MNHLLRLLLARFRGGRFRRSKKTRYIPEDIIINIFNFCGAESIFNCCLVSRRFRELAVQIEHISLQIPYIVGNRESRAPVWPPGLLKSLKRFSSIRYAKVEFVCDAPNPNNSEQMPESLLRWKHGPQGAIYPFAKKCVPSFDDDDKGDCTVIAPNDLTEEDFDASNGLVINTRFDGQLWLRYIRRIVKVLPNVQEVTAVDSWMQGRMVVDGGRIDFMRGKSPSEDVRVQIKFWRAHHVKVPFSEYVLKDVALYLVRLNNVSDVSVVQNFCEEGDCCQAAMRIMAEAPSVETEVPGEVPKYKFL